MERNVEILPVALEEAQSAIAWYAQRSRRAAQRFLTELERAIERISKNPAHFPEFSFETRRVILSKFPYIVVFREWDKKIQIVAVAHQHRLPGYWQERL